ncbi:MULTISPECIES: hypothetical protein [unclassified Butyrivibrio]|uniref:hypothetical protein n=1 Tax=unclassified Butyrivibrio TaxID=2639466 RepID=UPI0003B5147B|nr:MULTISPECIES: hypothetical protein [unclassified Butyrivibrio]SEM35547.1 hypothetical protein SAMN04487770_1357 [Butyrivibrio sp. ob235]
MNEEEQIRELYRLYWKYMIDGDTARMIGCSTVIAEVYGGGKGSWRLQGDFTLRKENGTWKLTSSKASTY